MSFLSHDPLLTYSFIASGFLLVAALMSGLIRLDFLAIFHPQGLLIIVTCVFASIGLMFFVDGLEQALAYLPWLWVQNLPATTFPLAGTWRLPLYLTALAYGPSAGLVSAGLFAAFAVASGTSSWQVALLAFELLVVGWLAIAPSPYTYRWAASLNILLAYLLSTITAGFALLQWQQGDITMVALWDLQGQVGGGVLLSAGIVSYVSPALYARLFAGSRIRPKPQQQTVYMPLPPLLESPAVVPADVNSSSVLNTQAPAPQSLPTASTQLPLDGELASPASVSSAPVSTPETVPAPTPASTSALTQQPDTSPTKPPLRSSPVHDPVLDLDRSGS
ncbi:MAG: hypothetical protein AAF708_21515 [Deinococcota bacterium]